MLSRKHGRVRRDSKRDSETGNRIKETDSESQVDQSRLAIACRLVLSSV